MDDISFKENFRLNKEAFQKYTKNLNQWKKNRVAIALHALDSHNTELFPIYLGLDYLRVQ